MFARRRPEAGARPGTLVLSSNSKPVELSVTSLVAVACVETSSCMVCVGRNDFTVPDLRLSTHKGVLPTVWVINVARASQCANHETMAHNQNFRILVISTEESRHLRNESVAELTSSAYQVSSILALFGCLIVSPERTQQCISRLSILLGDLVLLPQSVHVFLVGQSIEEPVISF